MSHTTDNMKELAEKIARIITEQGKDFGVDECIVDDFGRFGNFSLLCYLDFHKQGTRGYYPNNKAKFNMRKIVDLIKKTIREHKKQGAIFRSHESPEGIYYSAFRQKSFDGYEKNYISIDLDFIPYHSESNTFAVQTQCEKQLKLF